MVCHNCKIEAKRHGLNRNGSIRFRCQQCKKTFSETIERPLDNMHLSVEKGILVIGMLCEGISIRSIERLTGVNRNTVMSLLVLAGEKCDRLMRERIKNVPVTDVQCDEIWGFCYAKQKNVTSGAVSEEGAGDAYCFVGFERNSKMVLSWHLGRRTADDTMAFMKKLDRATKGFFQITTDGFSAYWDAVVYYLGTRVSFAQLIKTYSSTTGQAEVRYSPGEVVEAVPVVRHGKPDPKKISTSHVERQNLNIRMAMRRMTRLTNAFSKKWDNLYWAYALYFAFYNFCRIHGTTRVTPAMECGITDHVWSIQELLTA